MIQARIFGLFLKISILVDLQEKKTYLRVKLVSEFAESSKDFTSDDFINIIIREFSNRLDRFKGPKTIGFLKNKQIRKFNNH
jgi:hypothetical protein